MRPDSGVRAPALSLTTDCDMPPLTGNPRPSPASNCRRPARAVPGSRRTCWRASGRTSGQWRRSPRRQDEARQRDRQQLVQIAPAHGRQAKGRQALRHFSQQRHALRVELEESSRDNAAHDDEKRHRTVPGPELPRDERRQGDDADEQRHAVCLAAMCDEVGRALPEVAVRAFEAEELRQFCARQIEGQAGLESHQHRFGKEADRVAGADQPRPKRNRGDEKRHGSREGGLAFQVAGAQINQGRADQQRQRRRGGDDRLLRAAKDPEDEPRKQAGVEPRRRRQSRQRGIADAGGQRVRGRV